MNFIASLLPHSKFASPNQKQPTCPPRGQWINQLWYIHLMEYYLATNKHQLLIHVKAARPKCTIPFIWNPRKHKLIYSDRKKISSCLENGWSLSGECRESKEGEIRNVHKETFSPDGYIHCLNCSDGLIGLYMCQNLSNCTLSICTVYWRSIILK